ncbi:MAG: hypothetical protein EOO50_13790 [Flavobacterium sp.]|uniref:hypothetical protein n=1 Tax=Flavobacterium sp. TaxID=239 RepID=UPI0011FD9E04|nr:hypothetical protein [Flavobacterium sp.]RZJ65455.1 MAG: hypothetical protein EOO50_13790 [Flavobacterium sp.]
MRTVFILFVSLFSFLLKGNIAAANVAQHDLVADSHAHEVAKSMNDKTATTDWGCTLLEDADLDFGDDNVSGNDIAPKYLGRQLFVTVSHFTASGHSTPRLALKKRGNNYPPFCGQSSPIYITNRVIRI